MGNEIVNQTLAIALQEKAELSNDDLIKFNCPSCLVTLTSKLVTRISNQSVARLSLTISLTATLRGFMMSLRAMATPTRLSWTTAENKGVLVGMYHSTGP